jgi:hypothetical protein
VETKRREKGKRRSADLPQGKESLYTSGAAMMSSGNDMTTSPRKKM